jgi:CRP-like cAMP-binding protein
MMSSPSQWEFSGVNDSSNDKKGYEASVPKKAHILREGIEFEQDLLKKMKRLYGFFSNFEDDELLKILRVSERSLFKAGDIIIREGSFANRLFIIIRGSVKILTMVGDRHQELALLGPGNCFGGMSILEASPHSASVVANEDSLVFSISEGILRNTDPFLCLKLFKNLAIELSRKLREANEKIKEMLLQKGKA